MANTSQTAIEIKGLVLAIVAGVLVVGLAFGTAAVVRKAILPNASQPPARTAAPGPTTGTSGQYSAQMVTAGGKLFPGACASCHGASATGAYGPNLHNLKMPDSRIAAIIKNGKGQMPAFGKQYNDTQINDLVAYLRSLK